MVARPLRPWCARCARRTDYCDSSFERAEFPAAWPFSFQEERLPHLEALPASAVVVSACSAGHDVYGEGPAGPCTDFAWAPSGAGEAIRALQVPRSLMDHMW